MATVLTPKFALAFDIAAGTLSITDISTSWNSLCEATVRFTHVDSDTIIYNGSGWHATTPTWSTPPIHGSTITIDDIDLPTLPDGQYKIEYWTRTASGATPVLTTRYFTLAYESPAVVIDYVISCSASTLVTDIASDFYQVFGGVTVSPTITYSHTVIPPAGSSYTGTTGTTAEKTRTFGGGTVEGEWIWTKTWQIIASVDLAYSVSTWDETHATVSVTDTVAGNADAVVSCNTTVCALASCYKNLLDRWKASLNSNFAYREDKRDTVIQAAARFVELLNAERCGGDTESIVLELQEILSGENCNCTTASTSASVAVAPWGYVTGAITSASTFVFHIQTTNPTAPDGNNGDAWLNTTTGDLFKKSAGAWTLKGNIMGATGAAGASNTNTQTIISDISHRATPDSTSPTAISYSLAMTNELFAWEGDCVTGEYVVELASNDNGKTIELMYDGNALATYFCDDLVNSTNNVLVVRWTLTRLTNISQNIEVEMLRGGSPGSIVGPVFHDNYSMDLSSSKNMVLFGTNSVGTAADITGVETKIRVYKRETTLIPGGSAAGNIPLSQLFTATEGQTEFVVTDFTATDHYIVIIDDVLQDVGIVTRSGQTFTYSPGLGAGQKVNIIRTYITA